LVDSGTARPTVLQVRSLIDEIRIPAVFTPNGDGVNDRLDIEFTVLTLRDDRPVEVAIFDLSGRRVATAASTSGLNQTQSGTVNFSWDGTGASGDLMPPGIYIARVKLETDNEDLEAVQIVNLVY
jgi:gliding motility-associated-like protein